MSIIVSGQHRQGLTVFFVLLLTACTGKNDELPLVPPVTHPLMRELVGFGVINVSYTHMLENPAEGSLSRGYLRKGSVVKIIERRPVNKRGNAEMWVLAEGAEPRGQSRGWLREQLVNIYDNEFQANTASELLSR
jgi:hypothetical protein